MTASPDIAASARAAAQSLFLQLVSALPADAAACPELYVDGFDGEQIWVQVQCPLRSSRRAAAAAARRRLAFSFVATGSHAESACITRPRPAVHARCLGHVLSCARARCLQIEARVSEALRRVKRSLRRVDKARAQPRYCALPLHPHFLSRRRDPVVCLEPAALMLGRDGCRRVESQRRCCGSTASQNSTKVSGPPMPPPRALARSPSLC